MNEEWTKIGKSILKKQASFLKATKRILRFIV